MRDEKHSVGATLVEGVKRPTRLAVAVLRFLARCISCYMQIHHECEELAQLNHRGLRDIGLTSTDVAVMTRQPIWRRCWQSVRSCPNRRCHDSSVCMTECRQTFRSL